MAVFHLIMASAIICDWKLLVQAVSSPNSADPSVIQLQAAVAVLAMSKSILIVLSPGHCGLPGNELTDHQAKLGATETQPDNTLDAATQRSQSWFLSPTTIQHEWLKEVHTSLPDEQIKTYFSKMERTDLARFQWSSPCSSTLTAFGGSL